MAFRRSVLTSSVRFDERLGRGRLLDSGDEHVAFMSLISDGYRVTHAPDAVVRHPMPRRADAARAASGSARPALIGRVPDVSLAAIPRHHAAIIARFAAPGAVLKRMPAIRYRGAGGRGAVGLQDRRLPCPAACRIYWQRATGVARAQAGGGRPSTRRRRASSRSADAGRGPRA